MYQGDGQTSRICSLLKISWLLENYLEVYLQDPQKLFHRHPQTVHSGDGADGLIESIIREEEEKDGRLLQLEEEKLVLMRQSLETREDDMDFLRSFHGVMKQMRNFQKLKFRAGNYLSYCFRVGFKSASDNN